MIKSGSSHWALLPAGGLHLMSALLKLNRGNRVKGGKEECQKLLGRIGWMWNGACRMCWELFGVKSATSVKLLQIQSLEAVVFSLHQLKEPKWRKCLPCITKAAAYVSFWRCRNKGFKSQMLLRFCYRPLFWLLLLMVFYLLKREISLLSPWSLLAWAMGGENWSSRLLAGKTEIKSTNTDVRCCEIGLELGVLFFHFPILLMCFQHPQFHFMPIT